MMQVWPYEVIMMQCLRIKNEVCDQFGIERLFSNPFHTKGNAKVENVHSFLKGTLKNPYTIAILNGMNSFHLLFMVIT